MTPGRLPAAFGTHVAKWLHGRRLRYPLSSILYLQFDTTSDSLDRRVIRRVQIHRLYVLHQRPLRLARFLGLLPLRVGLEVLPRLVAGLVAGVGEDIDELVLLVLAVGGSPVA